jgi:photosystem II stability/assembly factor-like uncharacterized protein
LLVVVAAATAGAQQAEIPPAPSPTSPEQRAESWRKHEQMRRASPFRSLPWRAIGPRFQGGRVEALAVDPRRPATMYVGAGAGNLWKTVNAGTTWTPVFERQSSFSIGDVALAPSAPDVVWVGTGEVLMARSSFAGSGVFRSGDGGETWEHKGLGDTHHIAQVVVHPTDPDTVWVAAIGHLFSFNEERGVFKTTDGGDSWERVLYVDEATGAIDLVLDPSDSGTLYAAMWRHSRRAWGHTAAGATSGIYKSTDGGESWAQLQVGFPGGEFIGRIGLAIAPSQPETLYALVDNHAPREPDEDGRRPPRGEVYRSDDAGENWRKVTEENIPAGYDFCLIAVSPDNPERVHVPGQVFWVSDDGGATFREENGSIVHLLEHGATVLHLDAHEFWINPEDSAHQILGNDGGVYVTHDDGESWLHLNNLPLAEFYAINVDMERPFNVYGGTQDDAALFGPSNAAMDDGSEDAWQHVYLDPWGGGDSYFTPPHPVDTHVVFYEHQFGELRRKDLRDGTTDNIRPRTESIRWPDEGSEEDLENDSGEVDGESTDEDEAEGSLPVLRNNWMTPLSISHYDPDTLYYGTQHVLRSHDRGDTWEALSPDLTTDPGPERQGNVPYGTLTMVTESSLRSGTIWTGSDDGLVHVTTDDGATWTNVTPALDRAGAPTDYWVSRVTASAYDADRAYVAYTGYREDDFGAFLYQTHDSGKTWRAIDSGLPAEPVNAIAEDSEREGLLYVGTDYGVYASLDAGDTWVSLVSDLPTATVHDVIVHPRDGDLVIGTHGRSAFILDAAPIRAFTAEVASAPLHLFEVAPAVRPRGRQLAPYRYGTTAGEAVVTYALKTSGEVALTVTDAAGEVVRTLVMSGESGLNVLRWDLTPDGAEYPQGSFDPPVERVEAGTYELRLEANGASAEAGLLVLDP